MLGEKGFTHNRMSLDCLCFACHNWTHVDAEKQLHTGYREAPVKHRSPLVPVGKLMGRSFYVGDRRLFAWSIRMATACQLTCGWQQVFFPVISDGSCKWTALCVGSIWCYYGSFMTYSNDIHAVGLRPSPPTGHWVGRDSPDWQMLFDKQPRIIACYESKQRGARCHIPIPTAPHSAHLCISTNQIRVFKYNRYRRVSRLPHLIKKNCRFAPCLTCVAA